MMANENYVAMTEGVKLFLEGIGLEQHFSMFIAKGFDMESDIPNLSNADLDELQVLDANHRNTILKSAATFRLSAEFRVFEWLRSHGLDHYYINFLRADLTHLDDVVRLNLPDPGLYDELEITLPGHKGRLERAVRELRKRRRLPDDVEMPVCQGWWGRPPLLPHACYDFLCVEATIASPRDPSNSFVIEFMVDSGSDVTTVREEVLAQLSLEVLGTVRSQGVHSSRRKLLHRALLTLGDTSMEIEVLGESYDSLGSRVVRNFRHFISGSTHLWLRGDYSEHHIAPLPPAPSSTQLPRLALAGTSELHPSPFPSYPTVSGIACDQGTQLLSQDAADKESSPFTMDYSTMQNYASQPGIDSRGSNLRQPVEGSKDSDLRQPVEGSKDRDLRQPVEDSKDSNLRQPVEGSKDRDLRQPVEGSKDSDLRQPVEDSKDSDLRQPVEGSKDRDLRQPVEGSKDRDLRQPVEDSRDRDLRQPVEDSRDRNLRQPVDGSKDRDLRQPVEDSKDRDLTQPGEGSKETRPMEVLGVSMDTTGTYNCSENPAALCQQSLCVEKCQHNTCDSEYHPKTHHSECPHSDFDCKFQHNDSECQHNTCNSECQHSTCNSECQHNTCNSECVHMGCDGESV